MSRKRWPDSQVIAVDRDLLATTFTRYNSRALDLDGAKLEIRETAHFPDAIAEGEKFSLVMGELSASAGEAVAISEVEEVHRALAPGAEAFLLCVENVEKRWIRPFVERTKFSISVLIRREGYVVLRLVNSNQS